LDRRLGRPQSCSGCGGEEKNSQSPLGIKPFVVVVVVIVINSTNKRYWYFILVHKISREWRILHNEELWFLQLT
jgi:hypothetical protein